MHIFRNTCSCIASKFESAIAQSCIQFTHKYTPGDKVVIVIDDDSFYKTNVNIYNGALGIIKNCISLNDECNVPKYIVDIGNDNIEIYETNLILIADVPDICHTSIEELRHISTNQHNAKTLVNDIKCSLDDMSTDLNSLKTDISSIATTIDKLYENKIDKEIIKKVYSKSETDDEIYQHVISAKQDLISKINNDVTSINNNLDEINNEIVKTKKISKLSLLSNLLHI